VGSFIFRCKMRNHKRKIQNWNVKIHFVEHLQRTENRVFENAFVFLQFKVIRRIPGFDPCVFKESCQAHEKEKRNHLYRWDFDRYVGYKIKDLAAERFSVAFNYSKSQLKRKQSNYNRSRQFGNENHLSSRNKYNKYRNCQRLFQKTWQEVWTVWKGYRDG